MFRYYNPDGDHESGRIGEKSVGMPNHLMPYISQVAVGLRDHLTIHGNDCPTSDGTGERDYIHVLDLSAGHVAAINHLAAQVEGARAYNLGTGRATTVLELVEAFSETVGKRLQYQIGPRRDGDLASSFADPTRAESELGWKARRTIADMCTDTWRWQSAIPNGFWRTGYNTVAESFSVW
jgi:UDP-glucose 4-epimerase